MELSRMMMELVDKERYSYLGKEALRLGRQDLVTQSSCVSHVR